MKQFIQRMMPKVGKAIAHTVESVPGTVQETADCAKIALAAFAAHREMLAQARQIRAQLSEQMLQRLVAESLVPTPHPAPAADRYPLFQEQIRQAAESAVAEGA